MSTEDGIPLFPLLRGADSLAVSAQAGEMVQQLLVLAALILVNAFFAASEIAIISVNDVRIRRMADDGDRRAKRLLRLTRDTSRFLAASQIGVTLAGFLSSASAAQSFSEPLAQALTFLPFPAGTVRTIAMVLVTVVLSFFSLIFGELVPKKIAMQKAEPLALAVSGALTGILTVFRPFVALLSAATNGVLRLMGIDPHAEESAVTEEDILSMVDEGEEHGVLEENTKDMISNIFDFGDTSVAELMTHRTEVAAIADTASIMDAVRLAQAEGYSRIPVYHETIDDIRGILYVKDLLQFVGYQTPDVPITRLMHPAHYVPEVKKCSDLFAEMTAKKLQMAVVCDEYGGTSGIITMEDLLESIVGNIQDEYDDEEAEISRIGENIFTVDGATALDEVSGLIDTELPEGDYDTIAGFLVDRLGRIPEPGEHPTVEYEGNKFVVQAVEDRRIAQILIEKKHDPAPEASE